MTEYEALLTVITIKPKGKSLNSDDETLISLDDNGSGLFVIVSKGNKEISINQDERKILKDVIERMMAVCVDSEAT